MLLILHCAKRGSLVASRVNSFYPLACFMFFRRSPFSLFGVFPLFAVFSPSLLADELAAEQTASQDIETLVVSASKQLSSVGDATTNISVLNEAQIRAINPVHINESLKRIPGVWVSRGNGQEHLTAIRSPVLTGAGSCGAFFMAEDGISLRAPGFCNANQLFGVNSEQASRVEVLRGPQSTLYGANAVHGVLNVITPDVFSLPSLQWQVDVGGHEYMRGQFVLSQADAEQGFAVYGNVTDDGGYKDNSGFEQQKLNVLHQARFDTLSIKNHLSLTNLNQETAGFIQGFEAYEDPELRSINPNPEAYRDSQSVRAYSRMRWQMSDQTVWQLTPYFRYNQMEFLMHFLPWQPVENNGHRSFGVQGMYQHQWENVSVSVGADVDWTEGWLKEEQANGFAPHLPQGVHYDYEVDALNYALYADVNWQVTAQLQATFGTRFDKMDYDYTTLVPAGSACESTVENCRFTRPASQKPSFNDVSYKLGLNYQFADNHHVYSQYAQGFRPPQATELFRLQAGQSITRLDSEEMRAYEVGVRGQVSGWFYDVTWFDMNKDNYIFQDTQRQNIDNGETDHQGIEITTRFAFSNGLYIGASGTFSDHEYVNDIQISRAGSIQGNEIDTAPDKMANVQLGWREDKHFWELEWTKMGDYYLNPENTARYEGHELLNFRTGWQLNENWHLAFRLINLLDEEYAERADFGFGNYRYFVGEPRSVYFSVRYQQ